MPHRAATAAEQSDLFGPATPDPRTPAGWSYVADFLTPGEEAGLVAIVEALPLEAARYKAYTAKRRVAHFGTAYDFNHNRLLPGPRLPASLEPIRARVAEHVGVAPEALSSALVNAYAPGTELGWHRDVPDFEIVVGISLAGTARMRLRRWPAVEPRKADVVNVILAPRSIYVMRDEARWSWQHSVAPTREQRYSLTFRTRR